MSELRVDNIVSEDGSAAPIYSRGMNIGSGTTLTCDGNFVVGGATSIAGTVEVGGLFKANTLTPLTGDTVTISSGKFLAVGGGVTVTNAGTFTVSGPTSFQSGAIVTGVVTFTEADLQTSLTLTGLDVGSNIKLGNAGVITATSFSGDGSALTGIDATTIVNGTSNVTVAASGDITVTRAGSTAMTFTGSGPLLPDGQEMRFGTSADFRISHTGADTILSDVGTGDVYLRNDNSVFIQNAAGTETKASFASNGASTLYYDNSSKLATTSGGIDVVGTVTCDGLTSDGSINIESGTGQLNIKDTNNTGTSALCELNFLESDGTALGYLGYVSSSNSIYHMLNVQNAGIQFGTNNTWRAVLQSDGHFVPYSNNTYDLGTSGNRWRNLYTNDLNLSNEGET